MKKNRLLVAVGLFALFPFTAFADECDLVIEGTDQMSFSKKKMSVPASCETVKVTLKHTGSMAKDMMGHNWVLTKSDNMQAIVKEGAGIFLVFMATMMSPNALENYFDIQVAAE